MTLLPDFQHRDWSTIPVERVGQGIERQMVWGDRLMVCRLRFAPHVVTPVHTHHHEQITLVERGRVRFTVAGADRISSAGDVLHFPSEVEHGATMLDEEVVLIDIFTPVREDFLRSNGGR
jgi:quercetin dioxygenase-like cupin family protein